MKIRKEALELAFRIVLSCPCDVSHEEERAVFEYLRRMGAGDVADYAPILDIFGAASTPFHRLAAFTGWLAPATGEPLIEREHVLRLNASSYHWEHAASTLASASRRVTSVSSWMLAHMLLPVRLELDAAGEPQAIYEYGHAELLGAGEGAGGRIVLKHVFLPPELVSHGARVAAGSPAPSTAGSACARVTSAGPGPWAIHFAAVVGSVSPDEAELMTVLLEANAQLVLHRAQVRSIDYRAFEMQGDYGAFCRRRHVPFWGTVQQDA